MTITQVSQLKNRFCGANGLSLFYQAWYPAGTAKAVLALVHGFGEHCDRYATVTNALTEAGYIIFGFDNQGHGRSEGQRGHINHWQEYRDNVSAFLTQVRQHEPDLPLFVLGHSLGGLIVLDFALNAPQGLSGIIISGPPIRPVGIAKPYLVAIARVLSGIWPRFSMDVGAGAETLSRDPAIVNQTEDDPLTHSVATVRWGTECLVAIAAVRRNIAQLQVPILLVHGSADKVNDVKGSKEIFERIPADKTLKIYPGSYHEPHNDLDRNQVMNDIVEWLDNHLSH
ncbi:alpha beta hydrolase fold protein [Leptolyngbya sp. Heron Island J]|uniref:alpha/beta hydrolase n=1 Tax=Leptolyngbya sp. Heron Island J TaxID=1385935 RepID=UPI0003B9AC8F|nr:alpha/beta hydrolase [Leptolyngbya sp. Heron Island J]ESA32935.1 alpha beta hydrolase fold protein [Leptolyngbya sp. Heron Island J]